MENLLLFDFPEDIFLTICTGWIQLKDLCHLDSALCCKSKRSNFLKYIGSNNAVFSGERDTVCMISFSWMVLRNISIKHLKFKQKSDIQAMGETFAKSAKVFRRLRSVLLDSSAHITESSLLAIANNCKDLQKFSLKGFKKISDEAVINIVAKSPGLSALDLSGCWSLTDNVVECVAKSGSRLVQLDLSAAFKITDMSLLFVAKSCRDLRRLNLQFCGELTDQGLISVVQNCPQLSHLNISTCIKLTDEAVRAIAIHSKYLQELDASYLKLLSDDSIVCLAKHRHSSLVVLNLEGCSNITDAAVDALAEAISTSTTINMASLAIASDGTPSSGRHSFVSMNVKYCPKITVSATSSMRSKLPSLQMYLTHLQ